jgi:hypothetical protein
MRRCAAMPTLTIARPREVTVDVPVQYFQSVIALETAVAGVLLFQIHFFTTSKDAPEDLEPVRIRSGGQAERSGG